MKRFSTEEGLSDHRITNLLEHSNGFIYVVTYNGLDRFDGHYFTKIKLEEREHFMVGSVGPYVIKLEELLDGRILINYGIKHEIAGPEADIYNPQTNEIEEIKFDSVLNYPISKDCKNRSIKREANRSSYLDCQGNRLIRISNKNKTQYILPTKKNSINDSIQWEIPAQNNSSLLATKDFSKSIYLKTYNGLIKITPRNTLFTSMLNDSVSKWSYGLKVRSFLELENGNILVASDFRNLILYNPETGRSKDTRLRLPGQPVAMLQISNNLVWIFNNLGQFIELDLNTLRPTKRKPFVFRYFHHAISTSSGKVLISGSIPNTSQYCILSFDKMSEKMDTLYIPNENYANSYLLESLDKKIWLGCQNGLFHIDLDKKTILEAYRSQSDTKDYTNYNFPNYKILSHKSVLVIHEINPNTFLLGIENAGLNILDTELKQVTKYSSKDGLPHNTPVSILPAKKGYWIGTFNGLSHFDPEEEIFRNYFTTHGLSHTEFNRFAFIQSSTGINYFGSMNGMVFFDPEEIESKENEVKLLLSEISHFDPSGKNQIEMNSISDSIVSLSLPSKNRSCRFLLGLSDFNSIENQSYQYKLVPAKTVDYKAIKWKQNGRNRLVKFEYLPAGNHHLFLQGKSADGVLSNIIQIDLEVNEFFYKTNWFLILCLVGIGLLAYTFYRIKLNQALKMERMRKQISSNLHDDVGSVLSGVAYQMELLEYSIQDENKSLVRKIASSSRKAMSKMRDVIWAIDARTKKIEDLIDRMNEFADELLEPLDIAYHFSKNNFTIEKEVPGEILHSILMIYKEFLTNSVKHAKASKINCQVKRSGQLLIIELKDNGIGYNFDSKSTGQGLKNIKARAEAMDAKLEFSNKKGFGVLLSIPLF